MSNKIAPIEVPYEGPDNARILLVGESPGIDEISERRPFIGTSGQLLRSCLHNRGVDESNIKFANLSKFRPAGDKFITLKDSPELKSGIEDLHRWISHFRPTVIGALGNWPLYYLTGIHGKRGPGSGIGKWRGSILPCSISGCEDIKVIPTYHPAYIARNRDDYPIFGIDIDRILEDSKFPEFNYPQYEFVINPTGSKLIEVVDYLCNQEWLTFDIETVKRTTHILCISFSPDEHTSFVFPWNYHDVETQSAIHKILTSKAKKVGHNAIGFDVPQLSLNRYKTENFAWDTMVAQHVMWTELPKSLDFLTSVHTRQPYYKTTGRAEIPEDAKGWDKKVNRTELYKYCGTDTACTYAVFKPLYEEMMNGPVEWQQTFNFEMKQGPAAWDISRNGMLIDQKRRESIKNALILKWALVQYMLNSSTGYETNVYSYKTLAKILYDKDKMGLPPRKKREGNITTDEDAIVASIAWVKKKVEGYKKDAPAYNHWMIRKRVLDMILIIRGIRKALSSYINIQISEDGRARGLYKITGTETGRWSCSKFLDGTGWNAQTLPRDSVKIQKYSGFPDVMMEIINEYMDDDLKKEEEDDAA